MGARCVCRRSSNVIRHSPQLIPAEPRSIPARAYLTVHTVLVEVTFSALSLAEAALRCADAAPAWLTRCAHAADALVLALGTLLFVAYYGLVQPDPAFQREARLLARFLRPE